MEGERGNKEAGQRIVPLLFLQEPPKEIFEEQVVEDFFWGFGFGIDGANGQGNGYGDSLGNLIGNGHGAGEDEIDGDGFSPYSSMIDHNGYH